MLNIILDVVSIVLNITIIVMVIKLWRGDK